MTMQSTLPVTMRELARRVISDNVPELGGRVWERGMAPSPDETSGEPFALLVFGTRQVVNTWGARAWPMTVYVELPRSNADPSYRQVDDINSKIVAAFKAHPVLDEAEALGMLTATDTPGTLGSRYVVDFDGDVGADTVDEGWDALIHPIQFSLGALDSRPEEQHMVLSALRNWTRTTFPDAQVENQLFDPTDTTPSIGYRIERGELVADVMTDEIRWVDMLVSVHVITPDHIARAQWLTQIARALRSGMSARGYLMALPTSMEPETFAATLAESPKLSVRVTRNNPNADAFTDGQLTLTATWLDVDVELLEQGPLITEVILGAPVTAHVGPVS